MVSPIVLDFGNGIVVDGANARVGLDAVGLETPDIDVPVADYGVMDGGMVGASRGLHRQMTIPVFHERVWTREELYRAFAPGTPYAPTMRTISSPKASMPYRVRGLFFPKSMHDAETAFTVSLVSPWAYPRGPRVTQGGSSSGARVYTETLFGNDWTLLTAGNGVSLGQTASIPHNGLLRDISLLLGGISGTVVRAKVWRLQSGTWHSVWYSEPVSVSGDPVWRTFPVNWVNLIGTTATLLIGFEFESGIAVRTRSAAAGTNPSTGWMKVPGGEWTEDTISDYPVGYAIGAPAAYSTEVAVIYGGEIAAPARLRFTPENPISTQVSFSSRGGAKTASFTRLNFPSTQNGLIEIGDDPAKRTLSIAGTNRLGWFDRTKDWPLVTPESSVVEASVPGNLEVSFEPRYMGLI